MFNLLKNRMSLVLCTAATLGGLSATSHAAIILSDTFTYVDGATTTVSGGVWANHSGTAGTSTVSNGMLNIVGATSATSEDINAQLSGAPYTSGTLYAGMDIDFSALPTGAGTYFTHFKDATTSGFRGRVFATATGAASGDFRLGIADSSTADVVIPMDLSLNTVYRIVVATDTATGFSTLYINPTTETGGTAATDSVGPLAISTYAFRQSTGEGTLTVDNLTVATTFDEARTGVASQVPEPASLGLLGLGAVALISRRRK